MLENLIKQKNQFNDKFTEEYGYGSEFGICIEAKSEYLQWLARLGTYAERNLKKKYPEMTSLILSKISNQSIMRNDFDIISGYLDSAKEQEDIIKKNKDAIWDLNK
ncbi:hypothetical protein [Clostridium chrysemydis]|uniref:hypothetical protein n=1 Tax=Clostridium chrysemydis TaxID=2665504 RepID=UPI0018841677|nr:hypothetical protein [Clostridium chrysemydis]